MSASVHSLQMVQDGTLLYYIRSSNHLLRGMSGIMRGRRLDVQNLSKSIELICGRGGTTSADINDMLLRFADCAGDLAVGPSLSFLGSSQSSALGVGGHCE